jgi:predicted phage baseplate assembly protein
VANPIAASGGADLERTELLRHRGAATVRHQGRAVTREDYQDLARLASPQVARAECVPLCDVTVEPLLRGRQPGVLSVIVVPHTKTAKPIADAELLRQVRSYLDARRETSTDLVVVGPEYVEIDVDVEVVVSDAGEATDIATALRMAIDAFLHPLTGGAAAEGWRLGELPHRGDLYALCASAPGVTWVAALRIGEREDRAGLKRAGHFLVCSGRHRVALRYRQERRAAAPAESIGRSA